ncbi:unnamed protein product [Pleuronectes platessa]|uniref:Ig-like domain-containing protein n=1 Tax=Pleuronectes platessa TaxID=8262 RepID=A0A9N7TPJ2_PLEPL|nr:unnamed protein product [Pleuronectes platessa]
MKFPEVGPEPTVITCCLKVIHGSLRNVTYLWPCSCRSKPEGVWLTQREPGETGARADLHHGLLPSLLHLKCVFLNNCSKFISGAAVEQEARAPPPCPCHSAPGSGPGAAAQVKPPLYHEAVNNRSSSRSPDNTSLKKDKMDKVPGSCPGLDIPSKGTTEDVPVPRGHHTSTTSFQAVSVAGFPKASLSWYHNEEVLPPSEAQDSGGLWIRDCRTSDAGVYTCVATNELGEASCSTVLAIMDLGEACVFDPVEKVELSHSELSRTLQLGSGSSDVWRPPAPLLRLHQQTSQIIIASPRSRRGAVTLHHGQRDESESIVVVDGGQSVQTTSLTSACGVQRVTNYRSSTRTSMEPHEKQHLVTGVF